ncbi:hypothetical protein J6590_010449 [Homalodisca vitripennis]|nr:hypothetical protein J6590_010449 [Homalodisca vitripennis]
MNCSQLHSCPVGNKNNPLFLTSYPFNSTDLGGPIWGSMRPVIEAPSNVGSPDCFKYDSFNTEERRRAGAVCRENMWHQTLFFTTFLI